MGNESNFYCIKMTPGSSGQIGRSRTFSDIFRKMFTKYMFSFSKYMLLFSECFILSALFSCCVFAANHATSTQLLRNSDTLTSADCQILSIFDEFCRFMLKYVSICLKPKSCNFGFKHKKKRRSRSSSPSSQHF